jgi:hypothetical protein
MIKNVIRSFHSLYPLVIQLLVDRALLTGSDRTAQVPDYVVYKTVAIASQI